MHPGRHALNAHTQVVWVDVVVVLIHVPGVLHHLLPPCVPIGWVVLFPEPAAALVLMQEVLLVLVSVQLFVVLVLLGVVGHVLRLHLQEELLGN